MTLDQAIELALHIEPTEPISGSLKAGDGRALSFTGWLEFNSVVQGLLDDAEPATDAEGPETGSG